MILRELEMRSGWRTSHLVVLQKSERNARNVPSHVPARLDSHFKQAGDECHLLHAVSFFDAMHLT